MTCKYILLAIVFSSLSHATESNELIAETRSSSAAQLYSYIKTKYELIVNGRACIFYPAATPKKLVILFGYAMPDRYAMWTWFWRKDEKWTDTAYLFLKDDDLCWFLGNNAKPAFDDYCAMINHFISLCGISKDQVYTAGGSMGGYGAILFATVLGLKGAITDIPTVTKDIWQTYQPPKTTKIKSQDRWIDLDQVIEKAQKVPYISMHHGRNIADVLAAHALMDRLIYKAPLIIYRTSSKSAHSVFTITKASLEADIAYMEQYDTQTALRSFQLGKSEHVEYSGALFSVGYTQECFKVLHDALLAKPKGILLINPIGNGSLSSPVREQIESATELPFISMTYTNKYCARAYDLLRMMREKIGCFTLHLMPKDWQVSQAYLESELHHVAHQKLLQLPHFT